MTKEEQYCRDYMEKVYYFCLKRTGNIQEAEELAAEISVEILSAFEKGVEMRNPEAYIWKVARNRYAGWAARKHLRNEYESELECEVEETEGAGDTEKEVLRKETVNELRRELSLMVKEYREILVAYYIRQEKIAHIAEKCSIPEGTVKTRLYQGRIHLKGGMEMAREFGKLSYAPEEIEFSMSGGTSDDNVPDKFLWDELHDRICKNIMVSVYNNPSTLEMISIELGIALPYLEPFVEQMTEATILRRTGTNPQSSVYETNFVIVSSRAWGKMVGKLSQIQELFVDTAASYLRKARELQLENGIYFLGKCQDYEEQKWTLALRLADEIQWSVYDKRNLPFYYDTERPNGGTWDIMGNQKYTGKEFYWIGHSYRQFEDFNMTMFVTENQCDRQIESHGRTCNAEKSL